MKGDCGHAIQSIPFHGSDLSHLYRTVVSDRGTSVVEKLQSLVTLQYHLVELEHLHQAGGGVTVTSFYSIPASLPYE